MADTHKKTVHTFDDALDRVGGFGAFQKRIIGLMCVTCFCVMLQNLSPVFTMKIPRHRCKIPGLENDTYEIQTAHHAALVNYSVPVDDEGDYSMCSLYDAGSGYDVTSGNRSEVACDEWVYDRSEFKSTFVTELDMVCQKKQYRSHSTMMMFAGKFLGAFINSAAGDYFGRRRVYMVLIAAMTATGVGLMFVTSIPALMALRFLAGATTTGAYLPSYVIPLELVSISQRSAIGVWTTVASVAANLSGGLFAFLLRDWRFFQLCLVAPCLLMIIGFRFFPESPRWLIAKGRVRQAQKVIDQMAKTNGVADAPQLVLSSTTDNSCRDEDAPAARVTPLQLFRIPRLAVRYCLLYLSWILNIMCIYGLKLNVTNMKGDIFLNNTLMSLVDVVTAALFAILFERVGRRPYVLVAALVGGLACLSTILPTVLDSNDWILRGLSFVGMAGMSSAQVSIYIFSPELFPTVLRSFGLGSCSMMSRIGGLASPYVADLNIYVSGGWGAALPQIVFGVAGLATACMIVFMPETNGTKLPETVRDAELFGRSQQTDEQAANGTEIVFSTIAGLSKGTLLHTDTEKCTATTTILQEVDNP